MNRNCHICDNLAAKSRKGITMKYVFRITYKEIEGSRLQTVQDVYRLDPDNVGKLATSIFRDGFWIGDLDSMRTYHPGRCVYKIDVMPVPNEKQSVEVSSNA